MAGGYGGGAVTASRDIDPRHELAFMEAQLQVLLEERPPHLVRRRAQAIQRLRRQIAELEQRLARRERLSSPGADG